MNKIQPSDLAHYAVYNEDGELVYSGEFEDDAWNIYRGQEAWSLLAFEPVAKRVGPPWQGDSIWEAYQIPAAAYPAGSA